MRKLSYDKRQQLLTKLQKECVSKDATRMHLNGVYHCPTLKSLLSTDGHRLMSIPNRWSSDLAGHIINADDFTRINREYPKCQSVIPDFKNKYERKTLSLYATSIDAKAKHHKPIKTYFYQSEQYINGLEASVELRPNQVALFAINGYFLKPITDLELVVWHAPMIEGKQNLNPIVFDFDEYCRGAFYLVMPIKF